MIKITSPNFDNEEFIPEKYSYNGSNINPTFIIDDVPNSTKSLVLIMDDPDAISGLFTHWILYNIGKYTTIIEENKIPEGAIVGLNNLASKKYFGPRPPSGIHSYHFKIYALDIIIDPNLTIDRAKIDKIISNHSIDSGELVGYYSAE